MQFDPDAVVDDGSCEALDECGICGGPGIVEPACDCEGTLIDECGVCGGPGIEDRSAIVRGMWKTSAECVVETVQHASKDAPTGSVQFDPNAVVDDGSCEELDECGTVAARASKIRSAIVRNVEDECGICGGPGVEAPFCDCEGNELDVRDLWRRRHHMSWLHRPSGVQL